jgi:hypothetical protein
MNERNAGCHDELPVLRSFRRIYTRAAGGGREERLFGLHTRAKAEAVLRQYAMDASGEGFYFELPLAGEPRMDLLLQYQCGAIRLPVTRCACDSTPAPFDFSSFFEACARDPEIARYLVGFSFDLSEDRDLPGIYLLPPRDTPNVDHVPDMLVRLGASGRLPKVMEAFAAAPAGWQPYYAGYMDARPGTPTRLGFFLDHKMCRRYREDKALLKKDLSQCYRRTVPGDMLDRIHLLTQKGYVWDFQFDMFPDGDFAPALGVSVRDDADENAWDTTKAFLASNMPEDLMQMLGDWGLADDRRRLLRDACTASRRNILEDGRIRTVADLVSVSTYKVRFKNEEAVLAKGYLFARSCDL